MEGRGLLDLDDCPACGARWAYESDGKRYSRLMAVYSRERDITVAWRCPSCGARWERGADHREAGRGGTSNES